MLVKFNSPWCGHEIYINSAHVKTIRPAVQREIVKASQIGSHHNEYKAFPVAGHTLIEYNVATTEDTFSDTVLGTIDEVAAKLNGQEADHGA